MNKPIETTESTGLVPLENINALQVFVEGDFNKLLNDVRQRAIDNIPESPDMSAKKDRDLIRTTAAQVAKAKTAFDAAGKELVSDWKKN